MTAEFLYLLMWGNRTEQRQEGGRTLTRLAPHTALLSTNNVRYAEQDHAANRDITAQNDVTAKLRLLAALHLRPAGLRVLSVKTLVV